MSRPSGRELAVSTAFTLVLIGVAEIIVRTAGWPRLSALIVVLIGGHLIKSLVQYLLSRRTDDQIPSQAPHPLPD